MHAVSCRGHVVGKELDAGYRSRLARHEARTRADRDGTRAHGTSVQHDGGDVGRARVRAPSSRCFTGLAASEGRIISRDDVRFSHGLRRSQRRRHRRARDARRTRLHDETLIPEDYFWIAPFSLKIASASPSVGVQTTPSVDDSLDERRSSPANIPAPPPPPPPLPLRSPSTLKGPPPPCRRHRRRPCPTATATATSGIDGAVDGAVATVGTTDTAAAAYRAVKAVSLAAKSVEQARPRCAKCFGTRFP